jgi:hypothetical protein
MQMVADRVGMAGLRGGAADLLFELAESGLDTPLQKPL